jgi:hypothetical protein
MLGHICGRPMVCHDVIKKFSGNQRRATSYQVKTSDGLIVPNRSMSSAPYPRRDRDSSDECPYQTSNVPSTLTIPADNNTSPPTTLSALSAETPVSRLLWVLENEVLRKLFILESLSFALYVKRQTPGKEKCYGIRQ